MFEGRGATLGDTRVSGRCITEVVLVSSCCNSLFTSESGWKSTSTFNTEDFCNLMVSRLATMVPNPLCPVRAHFSVVMKLKNWIRRWREFGISLVQLGKVPANLCKGLYAPRLCPFLFRRVKCQVRFLMPDWISFESADTTVHNTPAKACSSALNT